MLSTKNDESAANTTGKGGVHPMWMMAICCALPILGIFLFGAVGFASPSLDTLLSLVCVVGMGYMMFAMHRDHGQDGGHAGCHDHANENKPVEAKAPIEGR